MSLKTKRQLPNINLEKNQQFNSLSNTNDDRRNNQQTTSFENQLTNRNSRLNDDDSQHSVSSNQYELLQLENSKTTKQQLNDRESNNSMISSRHSSIIDEINQSRFDPQLYEIKCQIRRNKEEQQRKLITSMHSDESNILHSDSQSYNTRRLFNEKRYSLHKENSINLLENTKSIRENVAQLKTQLMRNEYEYEKQSSKDDLSSLRNRRRRTEQDHRQIENEYLIQQQTMLSKSAALNEMLCFKKELEKSERQCQKLFQQLESCTNTNDEREKLLSKTFMELKQITENCDTYERQNNKLQQDLTLALEKLEEITAEAERFAQESLNYQKQLTTAEQKQEEFKIQAQETIKQWKARVKKLEKDVDRFKNDSTQMTEKNEQLNKEIDAFKLQNLDLREQITQVESDLKQANINSNQLDEQVRRNENDFIQLRSIRSSQETEIVSLKRTINELESQLSVHRQHLSQLDKKNQNLQQLLQEENIHRNNLDLKLKQSEQEIETINTSRKQFQQQIIDFENQRTISTDKTKQLENERDLLLKDKSKLNLLENDYAEITKKLETTKNEYTHGMKALQMDYENKIEILQLNLSDEKARNGILERHQFELKKDIERFQEKASKYEDETTKGQCIIETLSRENNDKSRLLNEFESKLTKLTLETTNQILKKDKDYQNVIQIIHNDIIFCTECLSNESNQPFIVEPSTMLRDENEILFSKSKAHLAWLKQELEIRKQQEIKYREDFNNALLDCEADRKYFASELEKREKIINELTNNRQNLKYENFDTRNEYSRIEFDQQQILTEQKRDQIDDRYRQFQTMIDSVKRDLHTAKVQLLA